MIRLRMLQSHHLDILEAQTADVFRCQLVRFASSLGFKTVSAFAAIDQSPTSSIFYGVSNTPDGYLESFHDERLCRSDPVMQHCKRMSIPLIWDQHTYVKNGLGEMWEHQARFGYHTGIAFGVHLPNNRHFSFGVDSDSSLPSKPLKLTRIVAELQLFAVHAQDAAFRVLVPASEEFIAPPKLTERELEVLKWTMEGRTAWEVGAELKVSERTAVFHLHNAMRKLRCKNKYQAVLAGIRLGLLA